VERGKNVTDPTTEPTPRHPREILIDALWLMVNAPDYDRMIEVGRLCMKMVNDMDEADVYAAIETIEGRIQTLERKTFGNLLDDLRKH
jgi:hypothetical protein